MEGSKETKNKRYDGELGIPKMTATLVNWIIGKFTSKEYLEYPELAKKYRKCCSWCNFTVTSDAVYLDGMTIYDSGVWRFAMPTKWISELFEIMKVEEEKSPSTSGEIVMFNRQLTEEEWEKAFELGKEQNNSK